MEGEEKILDVDRLANVLAGRVKVDGVVHDVLKPKGRAIQSVKAADASQAFDKMRDVVRQAVPTLTDDQVLDLNQDQITAIFGTATAGIRAVEAMFPNAFSPEKSPTSPG